MAAESDAPPVASSAAAASSSSGDVGAKPKAGLVTTYFLRSAMDWTSKRIDTPVAKEQDEIKQTDTSGNNNGEEGSEVEREMQQHRDMTMEVEAEPDASVVVDGQQVVDETREKQFEVKYQCLPDVEETTEAVDDDAVSGGLTGRQPMQYLDVLLQTDEHGVGLNVGLETVKAGEGNGGQMLVVQSFRRLNDADVGPAEACGKIRVGDIVHAVDGEEVCSLQQLHAKLVGRLGTRRKFVLFRFLQECGVGGALEASPAVLLDRRRGSSDGNDTYWPEVDVVLRSNPQIAALVRQLATTNQILQDQLIASRLKQEEQNIQIDQLHALYARTEAEELPLFSRSRSMRPFARKPSTASLGDGSENPIPTKIQTEVIEAVNAEYARLRQESQMQRLLDKRELERKYAERARKLEEATTKKVEMLEAGFQQALQHYTSDQCCTCRLAPASSMSNELCDHTNTRTDNSVRGKLTNSVVYEPHDASQMKLQQIAALMAEYEEIKRTRATNLQKLTSISVNNSSYEFKSET